MFRKVLLYGLPVYMYVLESLLKTVASVTSDSLAGPTLAGAGIGFLLPLTDLKQIQIDPAIAAQVARANARLYSPRDKMFTDLVWLSFFLALAAWMYSIFLTMKPSGAQFNAPFLIGCAIFIASIGMAEVKERI
jgi:hypothetical protein